MNDPTLHLFGLSISAWMYAPALFVLWVMTAASAKGFFFFWIRKGGGKTKARWDRVVIESTDTSLNIFILGSGLALLERLLPLPADFRQPVDLTVKVLIIVALFILADRLVVRVLQYLADKVQGVDLAHGIVNGLVRLGILSFGLLMLLDAVGIDITPMVASIGIGSLAVALGLQETLTNIFAGLYILADKPVRVGDFIKLETGEEGYVAEIGWRNTRIRMLPNILAIVPNNKIISTTIHNYYLPDKEMAALVEVGVHYQSDLAKVERVTVEVAREVLKKVPGAVTAFEPFLRYHTFAESSINFTVILRVKEFTEQYLLKHEFIKALNERYQKEGIVIPFPIRTLEISAQAVEGLRAGLPKSL